MWARRQVAPPTASGGTSRFLLPQEHTRSYGEEGTGQTPEGGPCHRPVRPAVRLPGKSEVKDSHPRSARRWLHRSEAEGLRVPQTLSRMRVFRASARAPQGGQEGATRGTAGPEKGCRLWGARGPRPGCRLTCDAPGGVGLAGHLAAVRAAPRVALAWGLHLRRWACPTARCPQARLSVPRAGEPPHTLPVGPLGRLWLPIGNWTEPQGGRLRACGLL